MELTKSTRHIPNPFWKFLPRPLPDSWILDFLYLAQLLILQDFILPQILGPKFSVDLITPWLTIVFVFRSPARILAVTLIAILLLETHSGLPRGLFFCLYWILGISLFSIRHNISWASFLPWGVVFFLSQLLVACLESLSYWTQNFSPILFAGSSIFFILFKSFFSSLFGLVIIYQFRLDTLEEQRLARR